MTTLITLTAAGTDTGPFNLYSNLDSFVTPFESGISKGALLGGYTSFLVPEYTETIRVKSAGLCVNYTDISVVYPTTTTTTTVAPTTTTTTTITPTTTTTTTVFPGYYAFDLSSPGQSSSGLACADVGPYSFTVYSDLYPLDFGHTVYVDSGLSTPVVGGDLWYNWGIEGTAYQVDNTGVITAFFNCL